MLAKQPDGQLYVLMAGRLIDILREKYPARDGEAPIEHFKRALTSWIASDDVEFTGAVFGTKREPPRRQSHFEAEKRPKGFDPLELLRVGVPAASST